MSKMGCMTHLGNKNTSYGQKKGWASNCQFDSRPLKVRNRFDIFVCRWRATYRWKSLSKGYNFALDFTSIKGCTQSYGPPKLRESQFWEFWDFHLGVPGQNDIWVLVPWPGINNTIRGKVLASPKSMSW